MTWLGVVANCHAIIKKKYNEVLILKNGMARMM